jgi:hypothetical protein
MLFDGVHSLEEVARAGELPETSVLRIALTLFCFGALHPVEAGSGGLAGVRPGVRDLEIERERVLSRYSLANESDYFAVLGVDRFADANEVRRAHGRLCKEIAPENLGPELWHELKEQVETIREVLDEGLRILCTPTLRSAYEFNLAHGPDVGGGSDEGGPTPPPPTAPTE